MLGLVFRCENALGITIEELYYYYGRHMICRGYVAPFLIRMKTDGVWKQYTTEDICQLLRCDGVAYYIRGRYASREDIGCVNALDAKVIIPSTSIDALMERYLAYTIMELQKKQKEESIEMRTRILSILQEHNIDAKIDEKSGGIMICNDNSIISPAYREYRHRGKSCLSVGVFVSYGGKHVSLPYEEHIAILHECSLCNSHMLLDWLAFANTPCPTCGNTGHALE
jgi:hypothetical protein